MKRIFIFSASLSIAACNSPPQNLSPGRYTGFLKRLSNGIVSDVPVVADLAEPAGQNISIHGKPLQSAVETDSWDVEVTLPGNGNFSVSVNGSITANQVFDKQVNGCYVSGDAEPYPQRICLGDQEVTVDFNFGTPSGFFLILQKYNDQTLPQLEKPADYNVSDLVNRAIKMDFNSRMQFEAVVQARLTAKTAYLNLLPHLSFTSGPALIVRDMASLASSIGDLVPFLLPNRWLQASEASSRTKADEDALVTMRADAGNMVEGISYGILRDLETQSRLQATLNQITNIRDEIQARESLGGFPGGTSDDITSIINSVQKTISALKESVIEEYTSVSQSAGFVNPEAVHSLILTSHVDVDSHVDETAEERDCMIKFAEAQSYELREMDDLIEAAQKNAEQRYFNWMDPAGDYTGEFGFNLFTYIPIGQSQVKQIQIMKEQMTSFLAQKVRNNYAQIDLAANDYQLSKQGIEVQNRRVDRLMAQLQAGTKFVPSDLVNALQDMVQSQVDFVSSQYGYYQAMSKQARLLYAPPYRDLKKVDGSVKTASFFMQNSAGNCPL